MFYCLSYTSCASVSAFNLICINLQLPVFSEIEYADKYFSIHGEGSCYFVIVIALIGASSKPLKVPQYKRALLKQLFQDNIFFSNFGIPASRY